MALYSTSYLQIFNFLDIALVSDLYVNSNKFHRGRYNLVSLAEFAQRRIGLHPQSSFLELRPPN